mgnify:CR=1 FL=1
MLSGLLESIHCSAYFFFLGFSKETLSMISALTGVHFTLLLAKFAGVLIEILHGIFYIGVTF